MVFIFKRGRNLVGYDIILHNRPGALAYISSLPEKYGLNIVFFETCQITEKEGSFFMVVDFTGRKVSPSKLLEEFRKKDIYVADAHISPDIDDIIYTSRLCIKDLGGMRVILFGLGNMRGIIHDIKKNLGKEAGESLLYHIGYGVGSQIYKIYAEPKKIADLEKSGLLLKALLRGAGWAEITEYKVEDKKIILKLEKLWECEIQEDGPASHYMRGILAGYYKTMLGKQVVVREIKCIAAKDDYCHFEIIIIL
jgi:predicted hydrocarbon binding protein